jgi:uncharacterized protein
MGNYYIKQRKDKILVLNKRTGAWYIGQYNDEAGKSVNSIENIQDEKIVKILKEGGIVDNSCVCIEQPFSDELTLLILDTTQSCNLACKYCFVDAPTRGLKMTLDTAIKALTLALEYKKCADTLTVEFSGGEPLLNFDLIKEFIPLAIEKASDYGKKLTFTIQTNGTLLSKEVLDFLMKYKVNIGISIDGTKDFHDKNRVFPDGSGSSDVIKGNIKLLQSKGCHTSILAVISSPEQYDSVIRFAEENNIKEIRTNLVTKAGRAEGNDDYSVDYIKLAEKYVEIAKKMLSGNLNIHDATLSYFLWNLILSQPHMCFRSPCGAGTNQISITSDGNIYPCQGWRNIHDDPIDNVINIDSLEMALDNNNRVKELRHHNVRNLTVCEDCEWQAFCGVCPREIYTIRGKMNERIEYCDFQAKVFEELMWIYSDNAEHIKSYLLGAF